MWLRRALSATRALWPDDTGRFGADGPAFADNFVKKASNYGRDN